MSLPSIEQDPTTGHWHWYDETWDRCSTAYATRADAQRAQRYYIDTELEGRVDRWMPNLGDYVWWQQRYNPGLTPAQVMKEALASNHDWVVRALTGAQGREHWVEVDTMDIEPMNAMEVLGLAAAWDDIVL